jgi:heme-degrading monooxygenase HmoA
MIVMVFEFTVPDDQLEEYQRESTELRRHLAGIEGFISVERFASTAAPGKFVAIGYFEDEEAVTRWRKLPQHRRAQALGRTRFFSRYRLVMAAALRDYSHELREQVPADSRDAHGS